MSQLEEKLQTLPDKPGVYLMKDGKNKIIYVGKAKSLRSRVSSYFRSSRHDSAKTRILVKRIEDLDYILTDTEAEALILENNLIKKHKPRYNISLKDDKSYPFIRITNEDYPRLFVTRNMVRDGSRYYGPYTSVGALRETVDLLKRLFPYRTCGRTMFNQGKPCLNYHIKRCYAPCAGKISQEDYGEIIANIESFLKGQKNEVERALIKEMEEAAKNLEFEKAARARDKLSAVRQIMEKQKIVSSKEENQDVIGIYTKDKKAAFQIFFIRNGRVTGRDIFSINSPLEDEQEKILADFLKNRYINKQALPREIILPFAIEDMDLLEEIFSSEAGHRVRLHVPQRGMKLDLIKMVNDNAKNYMENIILKRHAFEEEALEDLQEKLSLDHLPHRIECFDISNLQGSDNVASMVVFQDGRPHKRAYRKFKIKSFTGADDYRAMQEALGRRLDQAINENEKFLPLPDLLVIDGGKGQLSSVVETLKEKGMLEKIPVIALAERDEEIFIPNRVSPLGLDKRSPGLQLLQRVRDEAHRFALTYHRSLRTKRTLDSVLDDIPGIGPKRKEILLREFGSLYNIVGASQEELYEIKEIPKNVLEKVYNYLKSHEDLQMRLKRNGVAGGK